MSERNRKSLTRYPVREWYGKYSKWVLVMKGGELLKWYSRTLDRFFGMFPDYKGLEQFTSVEIADYRVVRLRAGMTESTVAVELSYIHMMWQWLVQDKGLPLHSIVRAFKNRKPWNFSKLTRKGKLSLEQATRIMEHCEYTDAKRHILHVMKGGGCYVRPLWLRDDIYNAAERAGVKDFKMVHLKLRAKNRLAQDIVKAYCDKILDTLPPKTQLSCNTLTTVEIAPPNEGATVENSNDNKLPISRILEQQLGAEG